MKRFLTLFTTLFFTWQIEAATLIVTYQTTLSERLERIRFLLADAQQQQMYPKDDGFVKGDSGSQMVLIEGLAPGEYTLEFVVPNRDDFFEEIPIKTFQLEQDTVYKIDQVIKFKKSIETL
ncbi:MAG: hypothetical protein H0X51_05465 [Parachlamydiaceae bacterium]|nr:hypothetical protein [Parachlamydiaceae bacterium]